MEPEDTQSQSASTPHVHSAEDILHGMQHAAFRGARAGVIEGAFTVACLYVAVEVGRFLFSVYKSRKQGV